LRVGTTNRSVDQWISRDGICKADEIDGETNKERAARVRDDGMGWDGGITLLLQPAAAAAAAAATV